MEVVNLIRNVLVVSRGYKEIMHEYPRPTHCDFYGVIGEVTKAGNGPYWHIPYHITIMA